MLQSTIAFPHLSRCHWSPASIWRRRPPTAVWSGSREAEQQLGLCAALAAVIPDWRHGPVRHSLETLVRQRVFQIACGYADQNDADTLRADPLLKLVCGRLPSEDPDLASQPTLSRLENAVDRADLLPAGRGPGRRLSDGTGAHGPSASHPAGSGRDRRSGAWPAGTGGLPRLLPPAHVPSAADLRRRHRPAHHGGPAARDGPRQSWRGGHPETAGPGDPPALAGGPDRTAGRQWLRHPGALRLLRAGAHRLHHRLGPQCPPAGRGRGPAGRGDAAAGR